MHFVRPADGPEISIIGVAKQFEPLVNKNIMHQEISEAIQCNTQPYPEEKIKPVLHANEQRCYSRDGKDQEEEIIVFKKTG
jgi:hypothetical protein